MGSSPKHSEFLCQFSWQSMLAMSVPVFESCCLGHFVELESAQILTQIRECMSWQSMFAVSVPVIESCCSGHFVELRVMLKTTVLYTLVCNRDLVIWCKGFFLGWRLHRGWHVFLEFPDFCRVFLFFPACGWPPKWLAILKIHWSFRSSWHISHILRLNDIRTFPQSIPSSFGLRFLEEWLADAHRAAVSLHEKGYKTAAMELYKVCIEELEQAHGTESWRTFFGDNLRRWLSDEVRKTKWGLHNFECLLNLNIYELSVKQVIYTGDVWTYM